MPSWSVQQVTTYVYCHAHAWLELRSIFNICVGYAPHGLPISTIRHGKARARWRRYGPKMNSIPRERGNGGKPLERMHTNARKCKCTEVHARARVRMNIHENANARTVGPINELLVVGECCFWTVSEESHACFSVPYRRYGKPVWRISNGYTK